MGTWKKICCPVDLSPVSRLAMEEAAELGWRFGAAVTLLHVDEPMPLAPPDRMLASREALAMGAVERDRQLEAWRDAAGQISTTRADCVLLEGDPASEIVRFAEAGEYDVIVMGTHGRMERDGAPFGSVAQKVVLDAPCPVLVVNARARSKRQARVASQEGAAK